MNPAAAVDQGDSVGASALFRACQYGAPVATLQALVRAGADVNKVEEENGTPPIQVACVRKHTALVRWLADPAGGNADVDLLNRQGGNVLCVAAMQGDEELTTFVPGRGERGSGLRIRESGLGPSSPPPNAMDLVRVCRSAL